MDISTVIISKMGKVYIAVNVNVYPAGYMSIGPKKKYCGETKEHHCRRVLLSPSSILKQYNWVMNGICTSFFPRYYRHNIQVLQSVVKKWNDHKNLKFVINVGDIVDGFCPKLEPLNVVQKVVKQFETSYCPVYHMIGNHCIYNLPRKDLLPMLQMQTANDQAYYDYSPTPDYRFVVLDGYDISAIGWFHDHPKTMEALQILQEKNPNSEKNSPVGMVGVERRFLMFNGAIGKE
ncbi:hypothetical protein IFM89_033093 [Coptis chinensis]|uniref:Calcineurin-like phosphoesterase domain-containing protein n=1 Tax=Coptis chinensis TaxID=261450 RepID=A0A835IJY2_9MAGN|nr:hypothetical protein IFM89_033093 [Coptis chinensis]